MRTAVVLLVVAACGADQGAYLTLIAPDGPSTAKTYELVLASPNEVPVIPQRVTVSGTATESVTYYLQQTAVAASGSLDGVNDFSILVEPSTGDGSYIPFVVLHDGAGALVGMGTFRATAGGAPAPILVKHGEEDRYELAVEPTDEVSDAASVDTRQAMKVECTALDARTWTSGLVWRPRVGGELRILLADPNAGGDATGRPLDLDCDGHDVAPGDDSADCDDTRARFHSGAAEVCDTEDTNCDNIRTLAVPCQLTNSPCGPTTGIALCDDTSGTVSQTCTPDPTCACANGASSPFCAFCVLAHETNMPPANETVPCQPGIGQLSLDSFCSGGQLCTVEVLGTRGGWEAKVSANNTVFGPVATSVGSNVQLKVRRPEGQNVAIPGAPGHPVGEVDLDVIDAAGTHHYLGIELAMDTTDSVCPMAGTYSMACSP